MSSGIAKVNKAFHVLVFFDHLSPLSLLNYFQREFTDESCHISHTLTEPNEGRSAWPIRARYEVLEILSLHKYLYDLLDADTITGSKTKFRVFDLR